MGRRNLSRLAGAVAAAALLAPAVAAALPYHVVATGRTEGDGDAPRGYVTRSPTPSWLVRLAPADRAKLGHVDFAAREVGAVFLDGRVCAFGPAIASFARAGRLVHVRVEYTRPPKGVAMCIKQDTPYILFSFARTRVPATRIYVDAVARA